MPDRWIDGTALHGLVCRRPWKVEHSTATNVTLSVEIDTPPWALRCEQSLTITSDRLIQNISVTSTADEDVPVGIGIHPWLRAGRLQVPADLIWPTDNCIPTGPPRPVTEHEDLRQPVVPPLMDSCYTGLTGTKARIGDLELSWVGPVEQVVLGPGRRTAAVAYTFRWM